MGLIAGSAPPRGKNPSATGMRTTQGPDVCPAPWPSHQFNAASGFDRAQNLEIFRIGAFAVRRGFRPGSCDAAAVTKAVPLAGERTVDTFIATRSIETTSVHAFQTIPSLVAKFGRRC